MVSILAPVLTWSGMSRSRQWVSWMKGLKDKAKAALEKVAEDMAWFYDMHCKKALEYWIGDKVWLNG